MAQMLVEPVTRIVTPSGPSVAGGNVGTPPTSYLPDVTTPPISEAMGVYEAVPSQPMTVSSGPVTSHYSLRLAPQVVSQVPQVVPQVVPMTVAPVVQMAQAQMAPITGFSASVPAPAPAPTAGAWLPPMPWPFTNQFHFTMGGSGGSPRSPSPILQERRPVSQRTGSGRLADMAADVEKLSQGSLVSPKGWEKLKLVIRCQMLDVFILKHILYQFRQGKHYCDLTLRL